MKSFKKAFNKNDNLYTPKCLVEIVIPYVKTMAKNRKLTVWCPFDTADSEYVIELSKLDNVEVISTSLENGQDFFTTEPAEWDIAISNPPFSLKKDIFIRLFKFGKPFALLMNIMALNYQEIGSLFADHPIQLLVPDKKVSFDGNTSSFCSGYVCKDFLPEDLMFVHLANNNSGAFYKPAERYKKSIDSNKK